MEFIHDHGTAFFSLILLYSVERSGCMQIAAWNQAGERIHCRIPVINFPTPAAVLNAKQKQNKQVNVKVDANQNNHS